jgi:hypothetical protein
MSLLLYIEDDRRTSGDMLRTRKSGAKRAQSCHVSDAMAALAECIEYLLTVKFLHR